MGHDLKEVINYSKANEFILAQASKRRKLDLKLILEVHHILMAGIVNGKLKGKLREAQNAIKDAKSKELIYLPPEFKDLLPLMNNLIRWYKEQLIIENSVLIIAALFHYYFVTLHPFMDGNGRTARLLTTFILYSNGFTVAQYSALEKQHEQDRSQYYLQLRQAQSLVFYDIPNNVNLSNWLVYWLNCLLKTYAEACQRLGKISTTSLERENNGDIDPRQGRKQQVLSLFRRHSRLKADDYATLAGIGRTQAVEDLNDLCKQGTLKRTGGGRSTVYVLV